MIDFVLKKDENYYLQALLKKCTYLVKQVKQVKISSDESDETDEFDDSDGENDID